VRPPTRSSTTGRWNEKYISAAATGGVASRNNISSPRVFSPQIVGKHPQNTVVSAVTVTRMWKALI
jgi:hypothetical protein